MKIPDKVWPACGFPTLLFEITIVIESVFAWPGLGRLFYQSITSQDLQVVQAIVLLLTTLVVIMNILTDLTYAFIDPRVRVR